MAERGDVDAVLQGHVENRLAGGAGEVATVDAERVYGHCAASSDSSGVRCQIAEIEQTPAGQVWSSMWARYSPRKKRKVLNTGLDALCPRPQRLVSVTISARLSSRDRSRPSAS